MAELIVPTLIVLDYSWHKGITFSGKFKIFPSNLSGEPRKGLKKIHEKSRKVGLKSTEYQIIKPIKNITV